MRWSHLKPADGRSVPWKNGGGRTLELAVEPPGATFDTGFAWRLSTAQVGVSGPFSAFPGLLRTLLLLTGEGLLMDFGDRGCERLLEPLSSVVFPGDWPATATLVGGPCTDLNLMVDPARCSAELRTVQLDQSMVLNLETPTVLVFVARGTLCVPAWDLCLGPRHTLRVDGGGGGLSLAAGLGGAALVLVELREP